MEALGLNVGGLYPSGEENALSYSRRERLRGGVFILKVPVRMRGPLPSTAFAHAGG